MYYWQVLCFLRLIHSRSLHLDMPQHHSNQEAPLLSHEHGDRDRR